MQRRHKFWKLDGSTETDRIRLLNHPQAGNPVLTALVILHSTLLVYSGWIHSPATDELGHLASGLTHFQIGNFDCYRVNPPLPRMVAALPAVASGVSHDWRWDTSYSLARPEWHVARAFSDKHGTTALEFLIYARWVCALFSLLCMLLIYRWSGLLYGTRAGLVSATLWCFSPLVITNAQLVMPDVAASALCTAACYAFWRWLVHPHVSGCIALGLLLGLAELTKFTLLVLPPLFTILVIWRALTGRHLAKIFISQFLLAQLIALLVINAGYAFEGSFRCLGDYQFHSHLLSGNELTNGPHFQPGNRFSDSLFGRLPVPLPTNYVQGIDRQKVDFERKIPSYMRGQWRQGGWHIYYIYALLVKEPVGWWLLLLVSIFVVTPSSNIHTSTYIDRCCLLLPPVVILGFVSSQTGFTHHLRYILPAIPGVYIWCGRSEAWLAGTSRLRSGIVTIALVLGVLQSLSVFPHHHAFFNLLVGGPVNGSMHLAGSNIDAGQDLPLLKKWLENHPDIKLDAVLGLSHCYSKQLYDLPDNEPPDAPEPGWYAVFVGGKLNSRNAHKYFDNFEPVAQIGLTGAIYHIEAVR